MYTSIRSNPLDSVFFSFDKCVTHLSYDCQISISICGFIVGVVIVVDGSDVCF